MLENHNNEREKIIDDFFNEYSQPEIRKIIRQIISAVIVSPDFSCGETEVAGIVNFLLQLQDLTHVLKPVKSIAA